MPVFSYGGPKLMSNLLREQAFHETEKPGHPNLDGDTYSSAWIRVVSDIRLEAIFDRTALVETVDQTVHDSQTVGIDLASDRVSLYDSEQLYLLHEASMLLSAGKNFETKFGMNVRGDVVVQVSELGTYSLNWGENCFFVTDFDEVLHKGSVC